MLNYFQNILSYKVFSNFQYCFYGAQVNCVFHRHKVNMFAIKLDALALDKTYKNYCLKHASSELDAVDLTYHLTISSLKCDRLLIFRPYSNVNTTLNLIHFFLNQPSPVKVYQYCHLS